MPLLPTLLALLTAVTACSQPEPARADHGVSQDTAPRLDPLPVDSAGRAWVEQRLARMTLRQRVAQVVFPWISGRSADDHPAEYQRMLAWARLQEVGGLVVAPGRPADLAAKLNAAQGVAAVPLLVVTDLETGPGMRLRPGGTVMPPAMAFGAAGDTSLARRAGLATAREARAVGIHATLGPILDVQTDPSNPIINIRSFGSDPAAVGRMATAWVRGAREGGLLTIGKHFPGHGGTHTDSHVGRAVVSGGIEALRRSEMMPFREAAEGGVSGILVGHIAATGVEGAGAPVASLSRRMITGELRETMGFRGLVMTDALNMGAVTREMSPAEAGIRALLAGADILLQPPGTEEVIDRIVAAVESGRIPAARVEDAARRVLMAKAAAGLHRGARVDPQRIPAEVGRGEHWEVARLVSEAAVTIAQDSARLLPLRRGARVVHLAYAAPGDAGTTGMRSVLAGAGVEVEYIRLGPASTGAELRSAAARARAADVVLVSASVTPHQYRALGLRGGYPSTVEALAREGRPVVAVSFGSPYLLRDFPSVRTYVLAWASDPNSQRAAGRVLTGQQRATGRSPVPIR